MKLAATLTEAPQPPPPAPQRAPEPQLRPHPGGGYEIAAGDLMQIIQEVRERVTYDVWTGGFLGTLEDRSLRFGRCSCRKSRR
jgi:hypothetical protein